LLNYSNRNVKQCKLEGSNNNVDWIKLPAIEWSGRCKAYNTDEIEIEKINNYTDWAEIHFTNTTAYTYYRLYCYNNWGDGTRLGIKEIEMMEAILSTYTASSEIFTSDHVGSIWQLVHNTSESTSGFWNVELCYRRRLDRQGAAPEKL
jgi:hypothetical protein